MKSFDFLARYELLKVTITKFPTSIGNWIFRIQLIKITNNSFINFNLLDPKSFSNNLITKLFSY